MFAPLRFIEPALVGEGITKFKARYAICAKQNQNIVLGFRDMPEIQSMIASSSIVMKKKEWLKDLPGKEFNIIKCRLEGDTLSAYNSLVSDWCTTIQGEFLEVDNPLTRLGKLLQIANGFSYINEKDPLEELLEDRVKITKRKTLFFEQQSKIRALHDLINDPERLGNRRSIIWYNFQAELEILEVYLKKQGTKYLVIQGGEKDVGGKINLFNNDPLYRFLLGQASTIRYGVTVMGKKEDDTSEFIPEFSTTISDEIFYSLNFSLEVFTQQTDRINRIGATKLSRYWLLLTNSCIEDRVYNALESKTSISKSLLIDISEELKLLEV
jgi:SNF2 family DNA or RNA helicase